MLVCPQCQFENPDNHKFCQKCGTSLTEMPCPDCSTMVSFDVEYCPTCGTATGSVWRAIVLGVTSSAVQRTPSAVDVAAAPPPASVNPLPTDTLQYLDESKRYQLLDPLPTTFDSEDGTEVRVLDCQPIQPSPLLTLYQQSAWQGEDAVFSPSADPSSLGVNPNVNPSGKPPGAVPAIAKPYLTLQSELYPYVPQIHDAWEDAQRVVVLLEDRSDFPMLSELWGESTTLPIQILHWMHEITELWEALESHQACRSLIEPTNLRVDEDQVLCLQRLYFDLAGTPPSLSDLGRLWRSLYSETPQPMPALTKLLVDLEAGMLVDIDKLHSCLGAIAEQWQEEQKPPLSPGTLPMPTTFLPEEPVNEAEIPTEVPFVPAPLPAAGAPLPDTADLEDLTDVDDGMESTAGLDPELVALATRLEPGDLEDDGVSENDDTPTVVLPMKLINIEDAGRSDVGRQRDHNEDFFAIQMDLKKLDSPTGRNLQTKGLYILCDGMGGHAGGEVASATAVDTLKRYFTENWKDRLPTEVDIRKAIHSANKAIFDINQQSDRSGVGRMGTTLVMVLVHDTQVAIAHVGDSRLYRFSRRRGLEQITVDHEVGQREIQRGVEPAIAYARPDAYQLTQALGPRDENFVNPDIQFLELNEDMLLLLCSDGLTDNELLETHWRTHIEPMLSSQSNLEQGVNQLIELANQYNGHDNITAVAIRAKVRPNLEQLRRF